MIKLFVSVLDEGNKPFVTAGLEVWLRDSSTDSCRLGEHQKITESNSNMKYWIGMEGVCEFLHIIAFVFVFLFD